MTVNKLGADALYYITDAELALFVRNLSLKQYMHEQIAQFLTQLPAIPQIDGFQDFVALFQKIRLEGNVGLLSVPGTTGRASQPANYVN
jgi:hypothetical protein